MALLKHRKETIANWIDLVANKNTDQNTEYTLTKDNLIIGRAVGDTIIGGGEYFSKLTSDGNMRLVNNSGRIKNLKFLVQVVFVQRYKTAGNAVHWIFHTDSVVFNPSVDKGSTSIGFEPDENIGGEYPNSNYTAKKVTVTTPTIANAPDISTKSVNLELKIDGNDTLNTLNAYVNVSGLGSSSPSDTGWSIFAKAYLL